MKKGAANSAFYKIFGLSFERLKQLMHWENEKDIGKPTVDSWRHEPRRIDQVAAYLAEIKPVDFSLKKLMDEFIGKRHYTLTLCPPTQTEI
jgi:hypothetical protein